LSSFELSTLERYLDTIQYTCDDSFENLANSRIEMESIDDSGSGDNENSENDDVGEIFKKVKVNDSLTYNHPMEVSYYSSGLFEEICFKCGKVPEEIDESEKFNDHIIIVMNAT